MAKKSRVKARAAAPVAEGEVGPRQPCPCGSGRRYKACHGAPGGPAARMITRPFAGLTSECDLIALRELVPAATTVLTLKDDVAPERTDREVLLASLLPGAAPALVRESGAIWLGLQVQHGYGDPARDLGAVLAAALEAAASDDVEAGIVGLPGDPGEGVRLQDLVQDTALEIAVHDGFDYWFADMENNDVMAAALDQANESVFPTARLTGVEGAYWTNVGTKEHLRWVMPENEDALLDALAKLHVSGDDVLVPGARFVGMFRAHGVLAPVWDLPLETGPEAVEAPAAAFKKKLDETLAAGVELTSQERSARSGLTNRQVTIR